MFRSPCFHNHRIIAHPDLLTVPRERWNCFSISGVWKLYEMARLFLHLHGNQDGNRWSTPWTWCYAPVSRRQYGKPCNPPGSCFDFCTAFWYCICLARCTSWLVCQLSDLLWGTQKIMAK